MNLVINHAPGERLIARPVDQQSSALRLYHGCPHMRMRASASLKIIITQPRNKIDSERKKEREIESQARVEGDEEDANGSRFESYGNEKDK